jgi:hypothetical protein
MRPLPRAPLAWLAAIGCAYALGVSVGCGGAETRDTAPVSTTGVRAAPSAGQDAAGITRRATALWTAADATEVSGRDDVSPCMRAVELLISHDFATVVPDRRTALSVLGHPEHEIGEHMIYVLSVRRLGDDQCRRRLEIVLLNNGSYGGFTKDETETCRSGHNPPP